MFWLLPFRLVVCMRAACLARGGRADVDRRIATGSRVATWSRCDDLPCRDQIAIGRHVAFALLVVT
ncbi:hypothetical protein Taro_043970 [Colocasia esculenta]|uniref:Secreted protein n=1 Tax=Colocasia esculenta TaxID=4460 RepID=A0A843X4T8_COLES|nr:hypothetical protein [Colocasia esculenta]